MKSWGAGKGTGGMNEELGGRMRCWWHACMAGEDGGLLPLLVGHQGGGGGGGLLSLLVGHQGGGGGGRHLPLLVGHQGGGGGGPLSVLRRSVQLGRAIY